MKNLTTQIAEHISTYLTGYTVKTGLGKDLGKFITSGAIPPKTVFLNYEARNPVLKAENGANKINEHIYTLTFFERAGLEDILDTFYSSLDLEFDGLSLSDEGGMFDEYKGIEVFINKLSVYK